MSLAATTRALSLCQSLEVHGQGQLLCQWWAPPLLPCQHVAHHQPKGHQQHPQGVGQDALRHKVAVGITAGMERDAQALRDGWWPVPILAGTLASSSSFRHTPWERSFSPNQSERGVLVFCSLLGESSLCPPAARAEATGT